VLFLHYWMERPVAEIARLLDLRPGTVKSHLHRARRRLGPLLEEFDHHG
jgi:DNA-directed RNA polymerase specialized sigma24 family protein